MGLIIVAIAGLFFLFVAIRTNNKKKEIHKATSIKDIVMSVNHGRIYPFYTRMNLTRVKGVVSKINPDTTRFEQDMQMQKLMGIAPFFDMPISNNYIERVSVTLSRKGLVSSIGVDIKNFDINMKPLINEMVVKFGRPCSMDEEFIIWREGYMVINIHKGGSLSVIDESIFGN